MGVQSDVDLDVMIANEEQLRQKIIQSNQELEIKIQSYARNMWWNGVTVGFLGGAFTTILLIMIGRNRK